MTSKHYLLVRGLHCLTGNKETVQITNQLCRCESYNAVLEIEIAQGQKTVALLENADTSVLPMQTKSSVKKVLTVIWVDNFDQNVD